MKIMVVDDSSMVRRHVSRTLAKMEHEAVVAEDGQICLNIIADEMPDVVLMDWNMPNKDGLTALKEIRQNSSLNGIKVIMMTTENKSEKIQAALDAGADEYIMKPFTEDILNGKLDSSEDELF